MDAIDRTRNEILDEINALLRKCRENTFRPIELSSAIIREMRIGGSEQLAQLLRSPQKSLHPGEFSRERNRSQMSRPEVSIIASLRLSARENIERDDSNPDHYYQGLIMRGLKADIYTGLKDDPLAKIHLGDELNNLPTESLTLGPRGEEVRYFGVRNFPSGDIVGLFGIWPGRESDVYAVVVDDKFREYFGLFFRPCSNLEHADREWTGLARFEQMRNEALGEALKHDGWQQLLPQQPMTFEGR